MVSSVEKMALLAPVGFSVPPTSSANLGARCVMSAASTCDEVMAWKSLNVARKMAAPVSECTLVADGA